MIIGLNLVHYGEFGGMIKLIKLKSYKDLVLKV